MAMITNAATPHGGNDLRIRTDYRAMTIATCLFFLWGFLTSLNDIIIPHLKSIFELSNAEAALVQTAFFFSFFLMALPAGKLVDWRGYKQTMVIGLVVMAAGALLFLPAARLASFPVFLTALFVLAAGVTCLQVAANPYVTNLGPESTAASRLNFSQALNSLGTTLAPLFGGAIILGGAQLAPDAIHKLSATALQAYRAQQASSVQIPYLGLAVALAALALALALIKLPSIGGARDTQDLRPGEYFDAASDSIWRHPWLLAGAVGIFLYVGAEVSIGSFLVSYFQLPSIANMPAATAANYVAFYWGGAMTGRFIGAALLQKLRAGMVLGFAAVIATALVLFSMLTHGHTALWAILLVGLFNSVMFPNIFTLGVANLGPLTSKGSSLLIAAIVGGALIPLLEGHVSDLIGIQKAFIIPALCYVFIAGYGFAARNLLNAQPIPASGADSSAQTPKSAV